MMGSARMNSVRALFSVLRCMGAATGERDSCLPQADPLLCNPNEFDREGTPPWL